MSRSPDRDASLDDFREALPEEDVSSDYEPARYRAGSASDPIDHGDEPAAELSEPRDRCQSCGSPVSMRSRRVRGDNADVLWHCRNCISQTAMLMGAGVRPDWDDDRPASSAAREVVDR